MGQVSASSTILIDAEPATVLAAIADYSECGRRSLRRNTANTGSCEGGQGRGTVAAWKLAGHQVPGA